MTETSRIELVRFEGGALSAIKRDGVGWLVLKPACEALGVDARGQQQRLERTPWAVACVMHATGADGKRYEMFCLRTDRVAMWLATIETSRIADPAARRRLELWQCNAAEALDRWMRGEVESVPTAASGIEDTLSQIRDGLDQIHKSYKALEQEVSKLRAGHGVLRAELQESRDDTRREYEELRRGLENLQSRVERESGSSVVKVLRSLRPSERATTISLMMEKRSSRSIASELGVTGRTVLNWQRIALLAPPVQAAMDTGEVPQHKMKRFFYPGKLGELVRALPYEEQLQVLAQFRAEHTRHRRKTNISVN